MKRRILGAIVVCVSLLLLLCCAATVALWVRGHEYPESIVLRSLSVESSHRTFPPHSIYPYNTNDPAAPYSTIEDGDYTFTYHQFFFAENDLSFTRMRVARKDSALPNLPPGAMFLHERHARRTMAALPWGFSITGKRGEWVSVRVRCWIVVAAFGGAALAAYVLARRINPPPRVRPGYCRKCGYDLHGITSNVCPECGTPLLSYRELARQH
jgi:hypothetical protein